MRVLKCAGCAGVATGSILVYAYILMYYTKNRGFENEGFEVESFFRPPTTKFGGRRIRKFWVFERKDRNFNTVSNKSQQKNE